MPKQKQDIFVPVGPAIQFDQPGQKWNILKGVTVAVGEGDAIASDNFDGVTLVNKGAVLGPMGIGAGVFFVSSDDATIENRETGYIAGFLGLYLQDSASAHVLNKGTIFGTETALEADDAEKLIVENHGVMSGIDNAFDISNTIELSGPEIKNFGTMAAENEVLHFNVENATATVRNKSGALIENTGDSLAIEVSQGALKLINKGTIIGKIGADDDADDVITNVGLVTASLEESTISTGKGADTITNEGTITAEDNDTAVSTGLGNDTFINEGTINGDVDLSGGNDVYKNKGGKVNGRIDPGTGNDKLVLGKSKDRIDFDNALNATTNVNRVKNFESGKDKFFLEEADFTGLTLGTLQKSEFTRGTEANGDNAQLIYDKSNGLLWFDDGAGGADKILFAELDDDTKLTHEDFTVYA
ncbi:hypothetical protein [Bauldia sp.]|uniref:hypothetical protein n=1 Tax=Bauldia sp. TaxID=2575872 RepID=UPI003BA88781